MLLKRIHWLFFIFFFVERFVYSFIAANSWNLNRTIGWGYDISNLTYWISFGLGGAYWLIVFVTYWIFHRLRFTLLPLPTYLHVFLSLVSIFYWGEYANFIDWICLGQFLVNVILTILINKMR